jgi:hypothetical protein
MGRIIPADPHPPRTHIGITHPDFRAELKRWVAGVRHYLV